MCHQGHRCLSATRHQYIVGFGCVAGSTAKRACHKIPMSYKIQRDGVHYNWTPVRHHGSSQSYGAPFARRLRLHQAAQAWLLNLAQSMPHQLMENPKWTDSRQCQHRRVPELHLRFYQQDHSSTEPMEFPPTQCCHQHRTLHAEAQLLQQHWLH